MQKDNVKIVQEFICRDCFDYSKRIYRYKWIVNTAEVEITSNSTFKTKEIASENARSFLLNISLDT
jgi:hypothetical protein